MGARHVDADGGQGILLTLKRALAAAAALTVALAGGPASAQDEHDRRLAAELLTMRGDLRRLADPATPAPQARGLRARLAGALSALPVLLRLSGDRAEAALPLREALAAGDLAAAAAAVATLMDRHPLDLSGLLPARPEAAERGRLIHEQACAGCHEAGDPEAELPALDLAAEARRMPPAEFAARLIGGLHGDRLTALDNPFPDRDLAALLSFYSSDGR